VHVLLARTADAVPKMVDPSADGMGKGQYCVLKEDVMVAVHAMFTEGAMIVESLVVCESLLFSRRGFNLSLRR